MATAFSISLKFKIKTNTKLNVSKTSLVDTGRI
jgi:hypothetical protein